MSLKDPSWIALARTFHKRQGRAAAAGHRVTSTARVATTSGILHATMYGVGYVLALSRPGACCASARALGSCKAREQVNGQVENWLVQEEMRSGQGALMAGQSKEARLDSPPGPQSGRKKRVSKKCPL